LTKRLDRGEVSAESVIILPVILGMIWLVVQAAVVIHAGNAAYYVASQAALAAARHGSTTGAAESVGARLARAPRFEWTAEQVTVQVEVVVPRAAPFFGSTVTRAVTAPRERFIEYAER
jgi:Flp pilus assembly protein TadG